MIIPLEGNECRKAQLSLECSKQGKRLHLERNVTLRCLRALSLFGIALQTRNQVRFNGAALDKTEPALLCKLYGLHKGNVRAKNKANQFQSFEENSQRFWFLLCLVTLMSFDSDERYVFTTYLPSVLTNTIRTKTVVSKYLLCYKRETKLIEVYVWTFFLSTNTLKPFLTPP